MFMNLLLNLLLAQDLPWGNNFSNAPKMTLSGAVSEIDKVPEEIYGKWAIHSTLLEAKYPEDYRESTNDIWIFSRMGDYLTLTNPITTATATIKIDEVVNNRARFSRESKKLLKREKETVQIAINENSFSGIDIFVIEKYKNGKLILQDVVKYKVEGIKISGNNIF